MSTEDDGAIAIEWLDRSFMVSISINGSERIAYAWATSKESGHNVEEFNGEVLPPRLAGILAELLMHERMSKGPLF